MIILSPNLDTFEWKISYKSAFKNWSVWRRFLDLESAWWRSRSKTTGLRKKGTVSKQEASNIIFTLFEAKSFFQHVNTCTVKVEPREFTISLFSDRGKINEENLGRHEIVSTFRKWTPSFLQRTYRKAVKFPFSNLSGETFLFLKRLWHEIFYYLVRKSFQNDEERGLFYGDSHANNYRILLQINTNNYGRGKINRLKCQCRIVWVHNLLRHLQAGAKVRVAAASGFLKLLSCKDDTLWHRAFSSMHESR